jgi:DNA invertase Pin-like site-specific DNA recombinase
MRVAIYARVSTDDKGQDPENQLRELRAWCINSGHMISREYVEHDSGRKGPTNESNSPRCSTTLQKGNSIVCCSGR